MTQTKNIKNKNSTSTSKSKSKSKSTETETETATATAKLKSSLNTNTNSKSSSLLSLNPMTPFKSKTTVSALDLAYRPRRLRHNIAIRNLVEETQLKLQNLIYPLFLCEGKNQKIPIKTLPGLYRYSNDLLIKEIQHCQKLGLNHFALFPAISNSLKNSMATEATNPNGLLPTTLKKIKDKCPHSFIITDVALDPFSSDGHDGLVENGRILNDATVDILCQMSLLQAQCGADMVAPSDMMDGRVGAIRQCLDENGFIDTSIMAYTAKYASAFYGPFREALDSAPKFGDKKTYQMNYKNRREALLEARLDINEGADIVMVKPALSYLDIISDLKSNVDVPVAAYNVSGEYAMVKFAAQAGACDELKMTQEILYSIRRAGADIILTYHAKDIAEKGYL